ncbi:hypothetical protein JDV02_000049 [Purpureocillium takamizusanense]|uniref:DUF4267 domain-containing protein n=1 Tax=Purpureocillium takamizusanense TaxID=2060973 RepID=A0A9Q8V5Z7_9HYPO|nr:uncharacterized protein JDV02_000049 [Purpureocillium takamizusanense]UNI13292.1 hypothetical protein JDV02_000049 [Purpureocillium takamizusanense]
MSQHPNSMSLGLGLAAMLLGFGLNGLARPDAHLKALGFPGHQADPAAHKLNHALMRIWGVRNLTVGSLLALIWNTGDEKLMGACLCVVMALPIVDGFVSRSLTGGGELQHWVFLPVLALLTSRLFGWFD